MRGLNEIKSSVVNKRLELAKSALREVLTTIVTQFLELHRTNHLVGLENLFRYSSREHKDSILQNYSDGMKPELAKQIDDRIRYEDEELVDDEPEQEAPEPADEKELWTQDQDDILIENYEQFS